MITGSEFTLPFSYPLVASYFHHGHLLGILGSYKYTLPWVLTNYINLSIPKIYNHYLLDFYLPNDNVFSLWDGCPWINHSHIDRRIIDSNWDSFEDFVMNCIDHGFYVCSFINQFYIPSSRHFKRNHQKHPTLIYGYNRDARTYFIADNMKIGKYEMNEIDFNAIELGYKGISNVHNYNQFEGVRLLSFKNVVYNLDPIKIKFEITCYLNSSARILTLDPSKYALGINIYEYLNSYIMALAIKGIKPDIRPFHVLKEHKKIIIKLVEFLHDNNLLHDEIGNLSARLDILKKAEILLNIIIKFQISQDQRLLSRACDLLFKIKEAEINLLEKLQKQIKVNETTIFIDIKTVSINKELYFTSGISTPGNYEVYANMSVGPDCGKFTFVSLSGYFKEFEFLKEFDLYSNESGQKNVKLATICFDFAGKKEFRLVLTGKSPEAIGNRVTVNSIALKRIF